MRRFVVKALVTIVALVAITCLAGYVYLRRSLPQIDGEVAIGGISAPVDIVRDADAIPHIFASTKLDALAGLGYAHAQDRLWQMEFQRRIGQGRLSEIFGAATIPQDRFLRTVGFGRAARAAWEAMPPTARHQAEAYVAGINAFIASHGGSALPPEFSLLRFAPERWTPLDVVVWAKMMAWDLSRNFSFELLRQDILRSVGPEKLAELLPPYAADGLSILSERDAGALRRKLITAEDAKALEERAGFPSASSAVKSWSRAVAAALSHGHPAVRALLLGATTEALGSNSWVVDGTLTASGKPLLANDPHLGGQIPSLWYLAHMSARDFDVIGATLPGTPTVAIGRNRYIAWGETNVAADVEDLYRERLDPTGRFAEFQGRQEPLQIVTERINVKGAQPIDLDVRISRHGPLVSDAINANNAEESQRQPPQPPALEPLAFRWTALDDADTTIDAFFRIADARNWTEFTAALRQFIVPSQNFVYADIEGHIGYYAPGRIPIRAAGDGTLPAEGWSGDAEWIGWVPFEELPHTFDPPEHFIVTANHRPAPPTYGHLLGVEWTEPYRAQRITNLLRRKSAHTVDDFAAIQRDTFSPHADALLPLLLSRARPQTAADERALGLVRLWRRDARGDSAGAAVFQAWLLKLTPSLLADELGSLVIADYMGFDQLSFAARFLASTLASSSSGWCDDVTTMQRETCDDTVSAALHEAVVELTRRLGGDLSRWRWDGIHRAVFPHQGLDATLPLRWLLSRSVPTGGDWSTVNVGPVSATRPFDQRSVASYRQVVDLSPTNDNRFIHAGGQSGHPLSRHYDDFLQDWSLVKHRPMRTNREEIERGALGRLRLVPAADQPPRTQRTQR